MNYAVFVFHCKNLSFFDAKKLSDIQSTYWYIYVMVRFILQVIKEASINNDVKIGKGLLVYVGFYKNEKQTDLDWALRKTLSMCLWEDENDGRKEDNNGLGT